MGICPECNEEIDSLDYNKTADTEGDYCGDYDFQECSEDIQSVEFSCPECHEHLTNDEERANEILKAVHTPLQRVVKDKINTIKGRK